MSNRLRSDEHFMRRAIELSRRGFPAPNPHVGCVIVREGEIVGEGYHAFAGGPHAEVTALHKAGSRAKGATAYVTLEPCTHFGKTPPCTKAILGAGVRRVVIACPDPNPKAKGGAEALQAQGLDVSLGLLREEAAAANDRFLTAMNLGRPHVTIKAAMSLDGRIALPSGQSKWITGPAARQAGHRLRAECAAVLVGRGTVECDDPMLTARLAGVRNQPTRIVLDPRRRLRGNERVFGPEAQTLWINEPFDLSALLRQLLQEHGVTSMLVEGGARTTSSFLRSGLVDRLELFVGPRILGDGPTWVGGLTLSSLDQLAYEIVKTRRLGPDLWISARPVTSPADVRQ